MDWIDFITKVGFPIALSVCLVAVTIKRMQRLENRLDTIEDKDRKEMTAVIKANTSAMNSLQNTLRGRPCLHNEQNPMGSEPA